MLSVFCVECHEKALYAESHYAECRYAECCYAKCRYAECCQAKCLGIRQTFSNHKQTNLTKINVDSNFLLFGKIRNL